MNAGADRDPLTMRYARTLKDTVRDPHDWWTTAEASIAEERHIRAMFEEPSRPAKTPAYDKALYLTLALVAVLFLTGVIR
jgi:hypothetical protein